MLFRPTTFPKWRDDMPIRQGEIRMQTHWNASTLPSAHVGVLLRFWREDRKIGLLAIVAALAAHGFRMNRPTYVEMEAGSYLPSDGERFIRAYIASLRLTSDERLVLVTQWAFYGLRYEGGEAFARECLHEMVAVQVS
jgi:hypothetical protein